MSHANRKMRPTVYGDSIPDSVFEMRASQLQWERQWTFVNCWHMNEHESDAMWRLYAKTTDAVATHVLIQEEGGSETTRLETVQTSLIANLSAATAMRSTVASDSDQQADLRTAQARAKDIGAISGEVKKAVTLSSLSAYRGKRILWVDDHPENNTYETQMFQSLGMIVDSATSTDSVMTKVGASEYAVVITDLRRGDDTTAGYELLDSLRSKNLTMPLIIYSGSSSEEIRSQAMERGAFGETSVPTELFKLVTNSKSRLIESCPPIGTLWSHPAERSASPP